MKAAVISMGSVSSQWVIEAMRKYFDSVDDIDIRELEISLGSKNTELLYKGNPLPKYDCIYAKGSFRFNPMLRSITASMSNTTYMPIKANAFTTGHDKLLTQLKLQQSEIPMPRTYLTSSINAAKKLLEKVTYPIIMKFPEGTQGRGVMYADSFASANSILDALDALKQPFLIQEYIETGGSDVRILVVGDKIVAAMKRKAIEGEKRSNIHAGGVGEPFMVSAHMASIAKKAALAIGAEICGIDVLEGAKGPLVIEVNLSPGLQGITEATKIDIADKIARFLYKKSKESSAVDNTNGANKIMEDMGINKQTETLTKEIISTLDFRGQRILLPEIISKISRFNEDDEFIIKADNCKISIEKLKC